ncbi:MAG: Crp/Fnr family transcriptional regulator [Coriobacteriia bacterium]|nr:Crp/Fnr family transcriptional regulator [Coriobacteriia bacterium]
MGIAHNLLEIYETARQNPLYDGVGPDDFAKMASCLDARTRRYSKGQVVLLAGSRLSQIGMVLAGSVKIVKEDRDGKASILSILSAPELFGEAVVCAGIATSPVTVQALEDCQILFLDYRKAVTSCSSACAFHSRLISNMLKALADRNLQLNQKIEILSQRTTREKLLCYLQSQRGVAASFTIPLNREELARYLCVDRSAMSNELGRMRDEGLIRFRKNSFELLL